VHASCFNMECLNAVQKVDLADGWLSAWMILTKQE
jgi:hypothetical protein